MMMSAMLLRAPSFRPLRRYLSSTASANFLAKAAAANDPTVLLGKFPGGGHFDDNFEDNLETTRIGPDGVECKMTVTKELCNNYG